MQAPGLVEMLIDILSSTLLCSAGHPASVCKEVSSWNFPDRTLQSPLVAKSTWSIQLHDQSISLFRPPRLPFLPSFQHVRTSADAPVLGLGMCDEAPMSMHHPMQHGALCNALCRQHAGHPLCVIAVICAALLLL